MKRNMYTIRIADENEREEIYKIRHDIYAGELHQHKINENALLKDDMDSFNTYIVVKINGDISGFVSITSPNGKYGLDKYLSRDKHPCIYENMYEGRLFTVLPQFRGGYTALLLFFGIYRFAEYCGGDKLTTYGRVDLVDFYKKTGLVELGEVFQSGEVKFSLMYGEINQLKENVGRFERILERVLPVLDNQLPFSLTEEKKCYHGGDFFNAVGSDFSTLKRSSEIINADVLDSWFEPSPKVTEALQEYLPWIIKTSPPTHADGLIKIISKMRSVPQNCILTGGGSSTLIFSALPNLLGKKSKVLLLNPTYGEYSHLLKNLVGCQIDKFELLKEHNYEPDMGQLIEVLRKKEYDMFILVNPNNPTGQHLKKKQVIQLLESIPEKTMVWIDETYIEYAGYQESLETYSTKAKNLIICKSMSKVYALSGVRCAYLVSNQNTIQKLKILSPPWAVSLPAQIAGVNALLDPSYYADCYKKTEIYKYKFISQLSQISKVTSGVINCVLCEFEANTNIAKLIDDCKRRNLFIRDIKSMGIENGNVVRITVMTQNSNERIFRILSELLGHA